MGVACALRGAVGEADRCDRQTIAREGACSALQSKRGGAKREIVVREVGSRAALPLKQSEEKRYCSAKNRHARRDVSEETRGAR